MKKRKFLAALLVLAMTLSLLPTAALAAALPSATGAVASVSDQDGNVYYYFDNLAEAFENAKAGDTVKLLSDYEDPGAAGAGIVYHMDGMTFDLNSHSYTSANFAHIFRGDNAAIKNGKMICSGGGAYALFVGDFPSTTNFIVENVQCTGGINVYNAKDVVIKGDTTSVVGTKYYAIWCDEASGVTVEGGTYTAGSKAPIGMVTLVAAEEDAASLTINGGHFIDNGKGLVLIDGNDRYKPAINGGTFSVDPSAYLVNGFSATESGGTWTISDPVAEIGDVKYGTLAAAIAAVPSSGSEPTVITLLKDVENAPGMAVAGGKNFIVDFAGHTYTLNKPGAGSTNTETNGFQLLKGSTIVFKDGTINISQSNLTPAESGKNIMRVIQNYANLTLEDMTIDGTNQYGGASYVMSFNNDPVSIIGSTSIIAAEGEVAFDADGNWGGYDRCTVTVNTTGTITGNIMVGQGYLNIKNANVEGGIVLCTSCGASETTGQADRISVTGGTFSDNPADYVPSGYHTAETAGKYGVHAITLKHHDAVPASCTVDGKKEYWTCEECGKLFADDAASVEIDAPGSIPATGHSSVTDDAVPATCTETGLTAGSHCSVCGATLVAQTTVPATGHTFGDWNVTKEPTTTEAGSAKRVCSVCSYEETKTIPVLGTYAITANVTNGTVTAAPNPAAKGETVTLTLTPDKGYSDADIQLYYSYVGVEGAEIHPVTITVGGSELLVFDMPDADVTVTGTFKPIAYQITYNLDGGTNSNANPSTYTVEKGFSLTAPTKSGYTFLGWSFNNNSGIIKEVTVKDGSTGDITFTAHWSYRGGSGGSTGGGSSSDTTTEKNPDGSTTTTTTDKTTGTITEVTKETDGSTTTVETKKDGTVTETVETANGTTGTVVTDKNGEVTEVSASVSAAAADDAAKTGAAVTLPVEVPVTKTTDSAPAVEVSVPKSSGSVKVEIPVENVTAGTVAVIVHADGTEEIVKTSVTTENGVALTLDGSATVKIIDNSKEFQDVQSVNHWAQDSIDFVTSRELFNGTSTTTFSPNEPTTRAQLMTVLARLDGADTTGAALDKGMSWAVENGISDGSNPNGTISRQQLAVMLYRYAGSPATQQSLNYPDADKVDGYAEAAMKWAVENGIVGGMDDGTLNPQGPATRAQVAAMMARFCTKMA